MCSRAAIGNLAAIQHGKQQQSMSWTGSVSPAYTLYGNPTPYTLRLKQDRPTLGLLIPHALVKTFAR